ncbi:MAG: hypothetical protein C4527_22375 [Candidatus Omnitrophota bacterium]|jgi:cytoskeletal protein CcmA (bactofilin family)|nr:MAG: hypothetical protein C4527_22375 [Candidatus Omnitrophota bacterium]
MIEDRLPESFVDQNTSASGTLKTDGNVRINGLLEGQVIAKGRTTIDRAGRLRGKIHAREAIIEGSVHGSIEATEKILISTTSVIKSNVVAPRLVVQIGAKLQGSFVITPDQGERERLKQKLDTDYTKPILQRIPFSVSLPDAKQVILVGSFTDWDENNAISLKKSNDGVWSTEIKLMPGNYEYLLLVDGDPMPDPNNPLKVVNAYGGENSILTVFSD